jgi:hypothetical protein
VCHNELTESQLKRIKRIDCELLDKIDYADELIIPPPESVFSGGCGWKLYPPRVDIESHEIVMDNDVIIHSKSEKIDKFLNSNKYLITSEALEMCYGVFHPIMENNLKINTGFVGYPPGFDLRKKLNETIELYDYKKWENHCDEQGMVATILQKEQRLSFSLSEINILAGKNKYHLSDVGMHFIRSNRGQSIHWRTYKKNNILYISGN